MREPIRQKASGLHISMPGLVTASFLDQIAQTEPLPERPYDLPTKRVRVNGTELHYFEFGEGEPVVFVHGSIGDYRTWGYQFEPFAMRHKVISYSRRYHYPNTWSGDGSDYSTGLHADDLAAFVNSLGYGPAHIVGLSTGASIAAQCAAMYPDVVGTLTVNEPDLMPWLVDMEGGKAQLDEYQKRVDFPAMKAMANGDYESCMRIFIDGILGEHTFEKLPPEMRTVIMDNVPELRAEFQASKTYYSAFTPEDAARISVPTLLIEGTRTIGFFRHIAEKFAEQIPHIERALIDGAPHAASTMTPDQFNDVVLDFLGRHNLNSDIARCANV
jgi:non-heme chloroperoxidase